MSWVYLLIAIAGEVVGTSALKSSEGFTKLGPSAIVVTGYGAAFYFLSLSLRTLPVGVAYAVWAGVGIVLIAIIGWAAFGQRLDLYALAGIALILSGLMVIYLLSDAVRH